MIVSNKHYNNDRLICMNIMIVKLRLDKMGHKRAHTHTYTRRNTKGEKQ